MNKIRLSSSRAKGVRVRTPRLCGLAGLALILHFSIFVLHSHAQGVITTVAGSPWMFRGDGGPATKAPLGEVAGVAVDAAGNLFVADAGNNLVVKISTTGVLTVVAGNGTFGFSGDGGPATSASLSLGAFFEGLSGVAVDAAGNLYIGDRNNNRVRKVSPSGIITTAAGNGQEGRSGDGGQATAATVGTPRGVALDRAGNLYIAQDFFIRKVSPSGIITTVAGSGCFPSGTPTCPLGDGGPATSASLAGVEGLAVDAAGNIYIADSENNHRIRKVSPGGIITSVAGSGSGPAFSGDGGPATSASLHRPMGVAVDAAGNLYIADSENQRIRKVTAGGIISTVAGNGEIAFAGDGGPGVNASLVFPSGVAVDGAGNLYICDLNHRIRKLDPGGTITTVAGGGAFKFSGDGGPATSALLNKPLAVTVDATGNFYVTDANGARIRRVSPGGTITTVAGNGILGFSGDGGPATSASLTLVFALAVDAAGNLYIGDDGNNRVRKVTPSGTITTVAGNGQRGSFGASGDGGPATSAALHGTEGLAVDAAGNLYISDGDAFVRKVNTAGILSTLAGSGCFPSGTPTCPLGDGGPATRASLDAPHGLAVDAAGNLYVADRGNRRIRKVSSTGTITTVAGNGQKGFSGDGGPATNASLSLQEDFGSVAVDTAGNLYIADSGNSRIRKVTPGGTITTIAGTGSFRYSGDCGPATAATLFFPFAVAVDTAGNLFIADTFNDRIRKVALAPPSSPVAPTLPPDSVVNVASFRPASDPNGAVAPGANIAVFGIDLALATQVALSLPLSSMLLDNCVSFSAGNNVFPAPLFFVSGGQINAQVPFDLPPGTASVQVRRGDRVSAAQVVKVAAVSPGIFTLNQQGTGAGAILHAESFQVVSESAPAQPGEFLILFGTGLGAVQPAVPSGQPAPTRPPLAETVSKPVVNIAGIPAQVVFSGLAPGFVGLYQVNVQVPMGVPSGTQPLQIILDGVPSNTVTLAVSQ